MNRVPLITKLTTLLASIFDIVISITSFNQTTHNLAITNFGSLNLKLLLWVENQQMCYSHCVERVGEEPRTVARFSRKFQKCECFLTSYDFLIEFEDTDPMTSQVFLFSREFKRMSFSILFAFICQRNPEVIYGKLTALVKTWFKKLCSS